MIGLLIASLGAAGVYLLYTRFAFGWTRLRTPKSAAHNITSGALGSRWNTSALQRVLGREVAAASVVAAIGGGLLGAAAFGGVAPAIVLAGFAGSIPAGSGQLRRRNELRAAQDAWPRIIEEVRVLAGAAGQPLPQAVFIAGQRAPAELRPAFATAQREWLLSTDFERTLSVLKEELADATADAACETLLIAHELGGSDVDQRLAALASDRMQDTQGRKDARAKQAGARFARRFVLVVPAGMALAGMQLGTGREGYRSGTGQLAVVVALGLIAGCWIWAGRIMALPQEERVFANPKPRRSHASDRARSRAGAVR